MENNKGKFLDGRYFVNLFYSVLKGRALKTSVLWRQNKINFWNLYLRCPMKFYNI